MLFQPGFGFMLFGFLIGDIVIFVLFFGVSSARVSPTSYEGTVDLAASLVSAVLICGTLYFAPAIVWQFRALILPWDYWALRPNSYLPVGTTARCVRLLAAAGLTQQPLLAVGTIGRRRHSQIANRYQHFNRPANG